MNLLRYLPWIEQVFALFCLTFFSGAFSIGANDALKLPGLIPDSMITLVRYFVWFFCTVGICLEWRRAIWFVGRDPFLWMLCAVVILSGTWSVDPVLTNTSMREIFQMTTLGFFLALRFDFREQVGLVALTFFIGGILSTLAAVGLPSLGQHVFDHPGAWKGVYDYKNTLGSMMILGSLAFFLLPKEDGSPLYRWGGFIFMIVLMLKSTSKTSLVLSLVLIGMLAFYRKFRWKGKRTVVFVDLLVLVGSCSIFALVQNWVVLIVGLGKDPTISGRTPIWATAFQYLLDEHPLLGYGRGAFWSTNLPYGTYVGNVVANGFVVPHGHNGMLDLTLDTGFVGLGLFACSFGVAYFRSLKQAYASDRSGDYWGIAYLTFLIMNNLTESYLLRVGNLYWPMYVMITLSVMVGYPPKKQSDMMLNPIPPKPSVL
jgi:exopolysaccharide production protein ExoQ